MLQATAGKRGLIIYIHVGVYNIRNTICHKNVELQVNKAKKDGVKLDQWRWILLSQDLIHQDIQWRVGECNTTLGVYDWTPTLWLHFSIIYGIWMVMALPSMLIFFNMKSCRYYVTIAVNVTWMSCSLVLMSVPQNLAKNDSCKDHFTPYNELHYSKLTSMSHK